MQKGVYRKLNLVNLSEEVSLKSDNLLLKLQDLSSVLTVTYTMIQTNLAFANTIWKHVIIKSLDYLFQNVFTESKASQKHSNFSSRVLIKFL